LDFTYLVYYLRKYVSPFIVGCAVTAIEVWGVVALEAGSRQGFDYTRGNITILALVVLCPIIAANLFGRTVVFQIEGETWISRSVRVFVTLLPPLALTFAVVSHRNAIAAIMGVAWLLFRLNLRFLNGAHFYTPEFMDRLIINPTHGTSRFRRDSEWGTYWVKAGDFGPAAWIGRWLWWLYVNDDGVGKRGGVYCHEAERGFSRGFGMEASSLLAFAIYEILVGHQLETGVVSGMIWLQASLRMSELEPGGGEVSGYLDYVDDILCTPLPGSLLVLLPPLLLIRAIYWYLKGLLSLLLSKGN